MFALAAAILWLAPRAADCAGISDAVKAATLPNGVRVLVLEDHKAPVATLNVFYKVGSRNEEFGKTGISHLLEHLMFRGTKKLKPEEFSNIIQENGGMDNAFTTADYTDYFEVINRDHFDVPISLESDRMANFLPQGFDSEKAVVIEERRMRTEDNPQDALGEVAQAQAFVEHPYHWPVIGWMQDLQRLTLADAVTYHHMFYSPQNAIVVAVGDLDGAKVLRQIGESFGSVRNLAKPRPVAEVEPPQKGERHVTLERPADLPALSMSYHTPNYKSGDGFALEVASVLMAGGKSSQLYRRMVVDKRLVVGVDASYDRLSFDPGLFTISAQMRPGVKAADALDEMGKAVAAIRDNPVSGDELQKAKNQEQSAFVFGQDSIFAQAMQLGLYEMLGSYKMYDQFLAGINAVSAADVQRVTKQYLIDSNRTVAILAPTGTMPRRAGGGRVAGGAIRHADVTGGSL
jgi:zinc protease